MKHTILLLVALFISCNNTNKAEEKYNQTESCKCPLTQYSDVDADKLVTISKQQIAICGYHNTNNNYFSEFVVAECGNDTIFNFWDALTIAKIEVKKDTLYIKEISSLPLGKNLEFIDFEWYINKLYYQNTKLKMMSSINTDIRKYSDDEIKNVLNEYNNADNKLNDSIMFTANKLFVAALSGSDEALQSFYSFREKYELDGAYSQEYKELAAMLKLYGY